MTERTSNTTAPGDDPVQFASWLDSVPSATVTELPTKSELAMAFQPDRAESAAVIDLTERTTHPYDEFYDLAEDEPRHYSAPASPGAGAATGLTPTSMISIDLLSSSPMDLRGMLTVQLLDQGFEIASTSDSTTTFERNDGTLSLESIAHSSGCLIEVRSLPAEAVRRLIIASMLGSGFVLRKSGQQESMLAHYDGAIARVVGI
ncbi:MAG: hypothetical protein V3V01_07075 [Acidimicrobiales bacterium]